MEGFELDRGRVDPQNNQNSRGRKLRETKKSQRLRDLLIQYLAAGVFLGNHFLGLAVVDLVLLPFFWHVIPARAGACAEPQAPFLFSPKTLGNDIQNVAFVAYVLHIIGCIFAAYVLICL